MLDALAVGDETDGFCQEEASLCPMKHEAMLKMASAVIKAEGEEQSKKKRKKKPKSAPPKDDL